MSLDRNIIVDPSMLPIIIENMRPVIKTQNPKPIMPDTSPLEPMDTAIITGIKMDIATA